jgi:hypothetical protein
MTHWYHSMDLPGIGPVEGAWDLRGRFDDYIGHVDLAGKTVLDVGTATGFLSFEAEKRCAAEVISFDAASHDQIAYNPCIEPKFLDERAMFAKRRECYHIAHRAFQSRARLILGDVYQLSKRVPRCDVAIVGQILVHLRDPLEALRQASLVANQTLVIVEGSFDADGQPLAVFLGGHTPYSWWHLSPEVYRIWLGILGFDLTNVAKNAYKCRDGHNWRDSEVWTFVASRKCKFAQDELRAAQAH